MENLITTHHEIAHIQYYLYYADQPYLYRDGANPGKMVLSDRNINLWTNNAGFHEGVANAVLLSVFNPLHFYRLGLISNYTETFEQNINFLTLMALKKVAYAPFAYLVDRVSEQKLVRPVNFNK